MSPTDAVTTSGEKAVFPVLLTMLIVVADAADAPGAGLGVVGVVDALVPLLPLQATSANAQTAAMIEPTQSFTLMIFTSLLSRSENLVQETVQDDGPRVKSCQSCFGGERRKFRSTKAVTTYAERECRRMARAARQAPALACRFWFSSGTIVDRLREARRHFCQIPNHA
jgi:hypothetical protein